MDNIVDDLLSIRLHDTCLVLVSKNDTQDKENKNKVEKMKEEFRKKRKRDDNTSTLPTENKKIKKNENNALSPDNKGIKECIGS